MGGLLLSEENNDAISFKSIFVFIHLINIANSYQKPIILSLKPQPAVIESFIAFFLILSLIFMHRKFMHETISQAFS